VLTPTDIHFLVGLLTLVSRPGGVELELGSQVQDEAAGEERDVDITIRSYAKDDVAAVYEGMEVKDHSRPLDVTHVEQLSIKLADMPDITGRGIVSASGYTEPAVRKASAHDVTLYTLRDWQPPMTLGDVTLSEDLAFSEQRLLWVSEPQVVVNPRVRMPPSISGESPMLDAGGLPLTAAPTLDALVRNLVSKAPSLAKDRGLDMKPGEKRKIALEISLEDNPEVVAGQQRIPITEALVTGEVMYIERSLSPHFKVLTRLDSDELIVGCAVAEESGGNLIGITVDQSRRVSAINISVGDRLLKKIYRRRLK
jgi:hypothetical protein